MLLEGSQKKVALGGGAPAEVAARQAASAAGSELHAGPAYSRKCLIHSSGGPSPWCDLGRAGCRAGLTGGCRRGRGRRGRKGRRRGWVGRRHAREGVRAELTDVGVGHGAVVGGPAELEAGVAGVCVVAGHAGRADSVATVAPELVVRQVLPCQGTIVGGGLGVGRLRPRPGRCGQATAGGWVRLARSHSSSTPEARQRQPGAHTGAAGRSGACQAHQCA
jgi:hypothetical protein